MTSFDKILVANRGEIAIRIMRTCRELGITAIGVYSDGEQFAPHVRYADDAHLIESSNPIPYLDTTALIEIARNAGADAVHPGYGFLAENARFAEQCQQAGIVFIGPPGTAIDAMGDKIRARKIAVEAGVPLVPGSDGAVEFEEVERLADAIGYPVALKAAAGGGGRGFRVARDRSELEAALEGAAGEAARYFSDDRVFLERYLDEPRHIEIQILADTHGTVIALGERDCSIQRRHQKLIEESPSPVLGQPLREAMEAAAIELARAVNYVGAGTVEFMVQDDEFYFLEMNTRIQVEHPVTEMITGVDLVAEQIRVAAGFKLNPESFTRRTGHAIECRINAEDPSNNFQPVSGQIESCRLPSGPGVRFDGAIENGTDISPRYDSLLGKLVVWAPDRSAALRRMRRALSELEIKGVATTAPFHRAVIDHPIFQRGNYDTRFVERHPEVLNDSGVETGSTQCVDSPKRERSTYLVEVNGRRFDVRVHRETTSNRRPPVLAQTRSTASVASDGSETIVSPIQGTVLSVAVSQGDQVRAGDVICTIEAMKMENEISAGRDGFIAELRVERGALVESGAVIAVVQNTAAGSEAEQAASG